MGSHGAPSWRDPLLQAGWRLGCGLDPLGRQLGYAIPRAQDDFGRGPFASGTVDLGHGSVADKVIRGVSGSILVVGPHAAEEGSWVEAAAVPAFKSILVPLDGSTLAEQALPTALSFATRFGSKLHLFRAVSLPVGGDGFGMGYSSGQVIDQLEDGAQTYLDDLGQKVEAPGGLAIQVKIGTPILLLEDYISSQAIDLVVMTSHGRSGLVRAALGSVTDRLLGNGTAPVLIVRST